MEHTLPVFLNNPSTKSILEEVIPLLPKGTSVYLFGGAVRNALYFTYHAEEMTQRDFDCIVIGDGEKFAGNLIQNGFIFGAKNSEKSKVLKKARTESPVHTYDDWLYLDCKIYPQGEVVTEILERISDFTISGVALDMKDITSIDWLEKVIAVPDALNDIREKNLTVIKPYAISLHKIIRMVSRGFHKPSVSDIAMCIKKLKEIPKDKFLVNTEKTVRYVGDEEKVIEITKRLGITFNILNFKEIS